MNPNFSLDSSFRKFQPSKISRYMVEVTINDSNQYIQVMFSLMQKSIPTHFKNLLLYWVVKYNYMAIWIHYEIASKQIIFYTARSLPSTSTYYSIDTDRLIARYLNLLPCCKNNWPIHHVEQYIRLSLIQTEDVTLKNEDLNEVTMLMLHGEIDEVFKKKEPLKDLENIFHYKNEPVPRVILIIGGPGECLMVIWQLIFCIYILYTYIDL